MFDLVLDAFRWLVAFFRSRNDLGLEIIALRQQLVVLVTGLVREFVEGMFQGALV